VVIEAGVVAGYVIAWAVRKARRAASRLDAEADGAIDAGLDKLHEVVAAKLGAHQALDYAVEEASTGDGQVSEETRQYVEIAVAAAARKDEAFGQAVTELVARLRAAEQAVGVQMVAGAGSTILTGDAYAHAEGGGIAFGQVGGDVHTGVGREPRDPQ
jgi:alkylhydroperoxidase/carboxymuconolactone decarboxylase family protein YurZ